MLCTTHQAREDRQNRVHRCRAGPGGARPDQELLGSLHCSPQRGPQLLSGHGLWAVRQCGCRKHSCRTTGEQGRPPPCHEMQIEVDDRLNLPHAVPPPPPSPRGSRCDDFKEGSTFLQREGLIWVPEPPVPEASLCRSCLPARLGRYAHQYLFTHH